MKVIGVLILMLLVAVLAGGGGYWYAQHEQSRESAAHDEPGDHDQEPAKDAADDAVVDVTVAPLAKRTIEQKTQLYGSIIAEPSDTHSQTVPFESRVIKVLVTAGEATQSNTPTVEVEASPDALLSLAEAKTQFAAATRDYEQAQQRFKDHLATSQDLSQAQQALDSANLKHQSLVERGVGKTHQLTAGTKGLVSKIDVQEGQIVAAGASLVEVAAGNRVEAKLGVSPDLVSLLKPDQPVRLRRVDQTDDQAVAGKIRSIGRRVDPSTRLVEIRVSLSSDASFPLDSFMVGETVVASSDGLVAPRAVATPDDSGQFAVFTVKDHRALRHLVRIGLQADGDVQLLSDQLKPGDEIVVSGNSLLQDGMKVNATPGSAPATSVSDKEDRS
ncbi:MAG TPA: efflux RND transporter periplasmic adaptor subunit [Tepidisphaeraceae bacterium]|nr:efflux RND transporter periplasmic adaptor subunit [Tepidisphaeraceae bacterium]